jgi:hypothetical protein
MMARARNFNTLFKPGPFSAPTPEKEKSKAMQTIEGKLMVAIKVFFTILYQLKLIEPQDGYWLVVYWFV